jgi:transposase
VTRQREQILNERKRLTAQGLSMARYYGHDLPPEWWRAKKFAALREELPEFLLTLLERWQKLLLALNEALDTLSEKIESAQTEVLPTGLGALTSQVLDREIGDWDRFKNRRQVASYTGLVPTEDSSGKRRFLGHITKHGNPRVRHLLIEASWRLEQSQPDYKALKQRRPALDEAKARNNKSARKKICVGLARQFIVDWWRIRTGRTTPDKLGLQMSWPSAPVLHGKRPQPAQATSSIAA